MLTARRFTPCSPRHGKRCNPSHAAMVEDFRLARQAQDERVESAALGYTPETHDYYRDVERPLTFGDWLHQYRINS